MILRYWRGDITTLVVDAIVNAANEALLGGGGVDGAIHGAAGPGLLDECRGLGGCATGEAKPTGGHDLPARWVIHAVGPEWKGGAHGEADPAISTGVYGYPKEAAARIAVDTVRAFGDHHPDAIDEVVLVAFFAVDHARYEDLLAAD